ncbi:MAG: hypothetical protein JNM44_02085 [Chitinophagaceae bacterium]|nr:hypothetical protein [Chitinophagaceae bacterium]
MRWLLFLAAFVLLSFHQLARLSVLIKWQWNQAYIAANLCENRSKPEMNCCGRCVLKKDLQALESSPVSSEPSRDVSPPPVISDFDDHCLQFLIPPQRIRVCENQCIIQKTVWNLPDWSASVFRPPVSI